MPLALEWDCATELGESPRWCDLSASLVFVDIKGRRLLRYRPGTQGRAILTLSEDTGCIALTPRGSVVAAMRSGLYLLDDEGKGVRLLAANPENHAFSRFNDGAVDEQGRWLVGTIDETRSKGSAHLYRFDKRGLMALSGGLMTSNGLAFSPDGRHLYHSDTPRFVVYRYDYDAASGLLANRRIFIQFDPGSRDRARPDGAAVDTLGCYWSALYDGARIERYDPDGRLMARYPLPARSPTMPCFGGEDLQTLYVTTASRPGDAHPGGLYSMRVETAGLPTHRIDLNFVRS